MQLGIGSYALAWSIGVPEHEIQHPLSATDLIRITNLNQLHLVQLADNFPLAEYNQEQLADIKNTATSHRVKLEIGGRGLNEKKIAKYLDLCDFFDSRLLRMVIDNGEYQPDLPSVIDLIKNSLSEFKSKGVQLAIENHDRLTCREFVSLIEGVGDEQVGICLDTVNSFARGEGLETVLDILLPYTINLHIKDFTIVRLSHNMGFHITGTPAGEGMLPLENILERLEQTKRCETAIIELWPAPESNAEKSSKKELDWLETSIKNLKPYFHE